MECPKCGVEQSESDTCFKCQIVISKYLKLMEERASGPLARPEGDRLTSTADRQGFQKIMLVIVALLMLIGTMLWMMQQKALKGSFDKTRRVYLNEKYGFRLTLPPAWGTYSAKEALDCPTLAGDSDDYYLLASPTEPSHALFVVNKPGISVDDFKATPWEELVEDTAQDNPVVYISVDAIKKFRVYRVGYMIGDAYREDNYFISNNRLMQIYYYVQSPGESPQLIREMKRVLEETLEDAI